MAQEVSEIEEAQRSEAQAGETERTAQAGSSSAASGETGTASAASQARESAEAAGASQVNRLGKSKSGESRSKRGQDSNPDPQVKFVFISTPTFEPWDWTNPDTQGIGGSETSHIEMAQRLARLGHRVMSFAPCGTSKTDPAGVMWHDFDATLRPFLTAGPLPLELQDVDVWVLYRCPELIDFVPEGAPCWLICQDVDYRMKGNILTQERANRLTRLVALCETQGEYFRNTYPKARVSVSSNGIKRSLIDEIAGGARNPHRLMYASSPDRGLEYLLEIFPRLREMVKDAELHIYYGFDNIEKVIAYWGQKSRVAVNAAKLLRLLEQPGVTFHGRMGQPELIKEWFKAGLWVHPSNFTETSCITCMDAQACGAVPVTSPVWAISENVQHGVFIEGDTRNPLVKARYVLETYRLMVEPERQEVIRRSMMPWAREHFDWNRYVAQWEWWASEDVLKAQGSIPVTAQELEEYPGVEVQC